MRYARIVLTPGVSSHRGGQHEIVHRSRLPETGGSPKSPTLEIIAGRIENKRAQSMSLGVICPD